jgi:murein DD-endopeptidase MepM/ murein hydrolase activator NlpD
MVSEALAPTPALAPSPAVKYVREDRIRPGDSLRSVVQRALVEDEEALDFLLSSPEGRIAQRELRAGGTILLASSASGKLLTLTVPVGQTNQRLFFERDGGGMHVQLSTPVAAPIVEMRAAEISSSLFAATDSAGLPDSIANQLVDVFSTEIDFHTDLRKGDRFSVIYETPQIDGQRLNGGRILSAEFVNDGTHYRVALYRGKDGNESYYTEDGRSLRKGFLRSPLAFSRVSSGFSRRFHPILKQWRQHKGVDFAARTGTPVKATADGHVSFVGTKTGYGKIIVVEHSNGYSTAYAHLSRFSRGLSKAARVDQGEIIGYVGQTGWATGPHLHYEVRINDRAYDPLTVRLPSAVPLSQAELPLFRTQSSKQFQQLSLLARDGSTSHD